jgi:ribosomal protein S8
MFDLAGLITALRVSYLKKVKFFYFNYKVLFLKVLQLLLDIHFIHGFMIIKKNKLTRIKIFLNYSSYGEAQLKNILLISRKGNRIF